MATCLDHGITQVVTPEKALATVSEIEAIDPGDEVALSMLLGLR